MRSKERLSPADFGADFLKGVAEPNFQAVLAGLKTIPQIYYITSTSTKYAAQEAAEAKVEREKLNNNLEKQGIHRRQPLE